MNSQASPQTERSDRPSDRMGQFFNFCWEVEFYIKIALSCTILQHVFYFLFKKLELNFISQVFFYWLIGSISYYGIGLVIEKGIKSNSDLREKLTYRVKKIKEQPFPSFSVKGILQEEIQVYVAGLMILYLDPEVRLGNSLPLNMGGFLLMRIVAVYFLRCPPALICSIKLMSLKYHEFGEGSSFIAVPDNLADYLLNKRAVIWIYIFSFIGYRPGNLIITINA